MIRPPAEGFGDCSCIGAVFSNRLGLLKQNILIIPPKGREQSREPTHSHGQVENATAPSAGGSPDPDGQPRLGKLPRPL